MHSPGARARWARALPPCVAKTGLFHVSHTIQRAGRAASQQRGAGTEPLDARLGHGE